MTTSLLLISWVTTVIAIGVTGWYYRKAKTLGDKRVAAERREQDYQQQLHELRQQSSQDGQKKSRFIASAAHDLRQPLHALSMFSDALLNQTLSPETQDIAGKIRRSVSALVELFNTLFDVAKLETGANEVTTQDVALRPIVQVLDAEYSAQATAKGLQWHCDLVDNSVRSDPVLLETILRNLLSNALRYTKQGGIGLYAKCENGLLHIAISDTGVGIPQQRQEEIFQEFHQLDNMSRAGATGLGLGLSIVDRLIKLLGHRVDVQSEVGRGTTFTLTLSESSQPALQADPELAPVFNDLAGLQVLVIDDDPQVREGMESLLQSWQCRVQLAEGERDVRELLVDKQMTPDAIISDYTLGKQVTGLQVLEAVLPTSGIQVPVLFASGDVSTSVSDAIKAKGYLFLPKPVVPAQIRSFLRNAARRKSSAKKYAQAQSSPGMQTLSVQPLLSGLVKEFRAQAQDRGIQLEYESPAISVHSNADVLESILRNLLNYAFKRSKQGRVDLRSQATAQGARIDIADTGKVPSPQTFALLQQYQADPHAEAEASLNLGVSLAFRLAHSLGHQIQVSCPHATGLTFHLLIPNSSQQ